MSCITSFSNEADRLCVIYWFHHVRQQTGMQTAYKLGQLIDGKGFDRNEKSAPNHRTKFAYYRHGLHRPRRALLAKMDELAPGSTKIANHVLWRVLKAEAAITENAYNWLRELDPELQSILLKNGHDLKSLKGDRLLGMIERRASLDALACLTVLARMHIQQAAHEQAWDFALATFRMLMILGHSLNEHEIAEPLFRLYKERIFDVVRWNGERLYIDQYDYLDKALSLHEWGEIFALYRHGQITKALCLKEGQRILNGDVNSSFLFWLRPIHGPDLEVGPPREHDMRVWRFRQRAHDWGEKNIKSGRFEHIIPDEVYRDPQFPRS